MKQTEGSVWAYSEPGRGSTFKVYLPRVWEEATLAPPPADRPQLAGTETVLLVEDEEIVRSLVGEMLSSAGYRELEEPDGGAALELAAGYAEPIDVLMTDVVMPGIEGRELAGQLVRQRPGVGVLFTSGYTEDAISRDRACSRPGPPFLETPFTASQLAENLRALLAQREPVAR